ncbi:alpha/beta hydrolase [Amycolatopsis minnesotensis]
MRTLFAVPALVLAVTAAAPVLPAGAAQARAAEVGVRLELPRPTGALPVGTTSFALRDDARADPWVPAERRHLMVTMWYPAHVRTGMPTPYLSQAESAALTAEFGVAPSDALTRVRTNSLADARPLGRRAPLVVLSPGFRMPRATLSSLAEELASRGYAVAGIGHDHEAVATTFPDGRTTGCAACAHPDPDRIAAGRAADVSFVLDRLTGPRPVWGGGRLIDAGRIALAGHSAGGNTVVPAMHADPRIGAGVTMDGISGVSAVGADRPYLMLGAPENAPGSPFWDRAWAASTDWKRWLTFDAGQHYSFSDVVLLADQFDHDPGEPLTGARGVEITRAYVAAFVDHHLRGCTEPLFDGPSARYPEARYWRP